MTTAPGISQDTVGDDRVHAAEHKTDAAGLTNDQVTETRRCVMRAANLGVTLHREMTYSEAANRWSGITERRRSILDQVPPSCDCSAFATWCYWDATRWLGLPDVVNGQAWAAGYTGTMIQHGRGIELASAQAGDLVFYGEVSDPYHVAV